MQLRNSFVVPAPVDEAWKVLLDVERIAPCMPGASVDSVDGDDISGKVTVKLGPIAVRYQGVITFVERDERAHRVVLSAAAKDKGGGTARARIAASLQSAGESTAVDVVTELDITGKPAQFGRGVMADVSRRVLDQFAANLSREIQEGSLGSAARTVPPSDIAQATVEPTPPPVAQRLETAVQPAEAGLDVPAKRAAPPLGVGLTLGVLVGWSLGRRSGRRRHRSLRRFAR